MRLAQQFAQHADIVGDDLGLAGRGVGHVERRLARKHQNAHRACVVRHLDIGVDAVAHHGDAVGLQSVTALYARQHVGVGFAQRYVGASSRGMFDALADRTAVDQHHPLVGGAHAVGVGGYVGQPLRHPPRGAAQTVVAKRHVERRDHRVGHVVGVVGGRLEACLLELRYHARRTQQKQSPCRGVAVADVIDGGQRGGVHLLGRGLDAQRDEFAQVVVDRSRRIVGQKRIGYPHLAKTRQKGFGAVEERLAHVDRAVHVERDMTDAAQTLRELLIAENRAIFFEFHIIVQVMVY